MIRRQTAAALVGVAATLGLGAVAAHAGGVGPEEDARAGLVVHEWGTFTQLSGSDGVAIDFRPLEEVSDLPSFVYASDHGPLGLRHGRTARPEDSRNRKSEVTGTVRMETPVIYFYAPTGSSEQRVDVSVRFPAGKITEYYPAAASASEDELHWGKFAVLPGARPKLITGSEPSHYYAAREVDADPIRVCDADRPSELEKFLFYRGVGTFPLPVEAKLDGDAISVVASGAGSSVSTAFVFDRRGDDVRFQRIDGGRAPLGHSLARSELRKATLDEVNDEVRRFLVAQGLFAKEAAAMVETWQSSWFEDGLRVFYALPRQATDAALPLSIDPEPEKLVRVLIGRAEVVTPELEKAVLAAVEDGDRYELERHGRFARAILERTYAASRDAALRAKIRRLLGT